MGIVFALVEVMFLLFLAILPAYIFWRYIYKNDRNKEPKKLLLRIIILGIVVCFPVVFLEILFDKVMVTQTTMLHYFIKYTVGIALIEEFFKFLPAYIIGIRSKEFDEVYDAIVYTGFSALGFAVFENILYVLSDGGVCCSS